MKTTFNYSFYSMLLILFSFNSTYSMQDSSSERLRILNYAYQPWEKSDNYINGRFGKTEIIKREKPQNRFGRCFDCTVKMSLGITEEFQKLPISRTMDILTELNFLNYCEQVESPAEGDIAVYCDARTSEINHFALVIDPYPDKEKQKCLVALKAGGVEGIWKGNVFDSQFGPNTAGYGPKVSFHRRKNEFIDDEKLVECFQKDIAQSPAIAKTIKNNGNLFLRICAGQNINFHKQTHLNKTSPYEKASFLLKNCMGLDVNTRTEDNNGDTALMLAAARQDASLIKYLRSMGADPLLQARDGFTALDIAKDDFDNRQKNGGVTMKETFEHYATINALTQS